MSSKSKQHSRKGPRNPKGQGAQGEVLPGANPAAGMPQGGVHGDEDELVHVPKGTNPLRFVLMIALIIVLLIIFIVPSAMMGTFGRSHGGDEVFVGWRGPDGEEVTLGGQEFLNEKRRVVAAVEVDPLLGPIVGTEGRNNVADEQVARFLILDQLAVQNGLHVSDADLRAHLLQLANLYQGVSAYQNALKVRARGMRVQDVEETIRRLLRAQRYLQVTALVTGVPSPEEIEDLWKRSREEVRLEFAWLDAAKLQDDARAELPDDEALATWYEELAPAEKRTLEVPEERSAEVVSFVDAGSTPAAGLLAAFPEETPEGQEPLAPEERTRQYYDQVYFWHFLQPAETDADGKQEPPQYRSFEDVQDVAAAEAPVFFAMQRWLASLREARQAAAASQAEGAEEGSEATTPEPVDLEAEARRLGLAYELVPLATRAAWRDREEHTNVGETLATRVFQTNAGDYTYSVIPRGNALSVVRVREVEAASMPPFADVKEKVADLWVEERAKELVTERLEALREGLSAEPLEGEAEHEEVAGQEHDHRYADHDAFRAAVEAAGATWGERAWFDKGAQLVPTDPGIDGQANEFLRRQRRLAAMADDEVSKPTFDQKGERAYVVRLAERRPVPIERMSPTDLEQMEGFASQMHEAEMLQQPSVDYLERQFGLYFTREERGEDEAPEDELPSEG